MFCCFFPHVCIVSRLLIWTHLISVQFCRFLRFSCANSMWSKNQRDYTNVYIYAFKTILFCKSKRKENSVTTKDNSFIAVQNAVAWFVTSLSLSLNVSALIQWEICAETQTNEVKATTTAGAAAAKQEETTSHLYSFHNDFLLFRFLYNCVLKRDEKRVVFHSIFSPFCSSASEKKATTPYTHTHKQKKCFQRKRKGQKQSLTALRTDSLRRNFFILFPGLCLTYVFLWFAALKFYRTNNTHTITLYCVEFAIFWNVTESTREREKRFFIWDFF